MADFPICKIPDCGKPILVKSRGLCSTHYQRWRKHCDPLMLTRRAQNGVPRRFFFEVVLQFDRDECLIWPYAGTAGYGRIRYGGRMQLVHRLACETRHGPAPSPKHEAAHSCGKGHEGCVNPRHLRWATCKENHADTFMHGTHTRGENNANAKLTESEVSQIRALRGRFSQSKIAADFGVSQRNVCLIQAGKAWAWLAS